MKLLSVNVGLPREIEAGLGFTLPFFREGEVTAGDSIEFVKQDEHAVTIADIVSLYGRDATNQDLLHRVSELSSLPKSWRDYFRTRLWNPDK